MPYITRKTNKVTTSLIRFTEVEIPLVTRTVIYINAVTVVINNAVYTSKITEETRATVIRIIAKIIIEITKKATTKISGEITPGIISNVLIISRPKNEASATDEKAFADRSDPDKLARRIAVSTRNASLAQIKKI